MKPTPPALKALIRKYKGIVDQSFGGPSAGDNGLFVSFRNRQDASRFAAEAEALGFSAEHDPMDPPDEDFPVVDNWSRAVDVRFASIRRAKKKWIPKDLEEGRCTPAPNPDCPVGSPQYNLAQTFKRHPEWGEKGGKKAMSFRSKLIRLANEHPELRPHLLPLLRKDGGRRASRSKRATKVDMGRIVVTRGVNEAMRDDAAFARLVQKALRRQAQGDWGDTQGQDRRMNDKALKSGDDRIFSVFKGGPEGKIWVITEWDRSATTVLFPSEY